MGDLFPSLTEALQSPVQWWRGEAHHLCLPLPCFGEQRPISLVGVKTKELAQHLQPCPAAPQCSWKTSLHNPHRASMANSKRTRGSRPATRALLLLRITTEKYNSSLLTGKGNVMGSVLLPSPAKGLRQRPAHQQEEPVNPLTCCKYVSSPSGREPSILHGCHLMMRSCPFKNKSALIYHLFTVFERFSFPLF